MAKVEAAQDRIDCERGGDEPTHGSPARGAYRVLAQPSCGLLWP